MPRGDIAERPVRFSRVSVLLVMFCSGLALVRGAAEAGLPGVDDPWKRYESPHFELFSQANEGDSRRMLRQLELLHAVFAHMMRTQSQRPHRVTIYYFGSQTSFRSYTPLALRGRNRLAGFYLQGNARSLIVVSPVWNEEGAQRVIFHEYIHHLSRLNGETPPLWYSEGIAEFFSTIREDGDQLSLGLPINQHVAYLRKNPLMPLGTLFEWDRRSGDYNEADRVGVFYAQSWALLHYWYCGKIGMTPEKRAARDRFFSMIRLEGEQGDPVKREAMFKESMGMDYPETVRALLSYVRTGQYTWSKIPTPNIAPMSSYAVESVEEAEIARELAELQLRVNRSPVVLPLEQP